MKTPSATAASCATAPGRWARIVEQKDASPEEAAITECNSGVYCFDARALFDALSQVNSDNAQGEFYLTDVLAISRAGRAGPCSPIRRAMRSSAWA